MAVGLFTLVILNLRQKLQWQQINVMMCSIISTVEISTKL